ncbi:dihydroxyacetone kinase subunit DhaL [Ornithinibacillus scapharcae]|uniref:dihydroxyacetone kinase subunit DhaL n=1 Tax=Ornithinibacillus scapharcae TaxID=1147159 RepID=UPI000225BB6C|nr:dihydroxyacetone kinase subunit DhaL [Ornithinibacillus scapharcae]
MELNVNDFMRWIELTNETIQQQKNYLTSLDQPIGDGDHGINMARGLQEVMNKLQTNEYQEPSEVLKNVSMTLLSKVGGASGPLYGTAFLKMSMAIKGLNSVSMEDFTKGLQVALDGIKQRGKSNAGEKTLIDVWSPVVEHFSNQDVTSDRLMETAKRAMEETTNTIATKGRAAYFKEKSLGHIDPGSASSFYMFEALAKVLKEKE